MVIPPFCHHIATTFIVYLIMLFKTLSTLVIPQKWLSTFTSAISSFLSCASSLAMIQHHTLLLVLLQFCTLFSKQGEIVSLTSFSSYCTLLEFCVLFLDPDFCLQSPPELRYLNLSTLFSFISCIPVSQSWFLLKFNYPIFFLLILSLLSSKVALHCSNKQAMVIVG